MYHSDTGCYQQQIIATKQIEKQIIKHATHIYVLLRAFLFILRVQRVRIVAKRQDALRVVRLNLRKECLHADFVGLFI